MNTHAAEALSTAGMESYVVARKHFVATGLPLHVCAERFAQAPAKLDWRHEAVLTKAFDRGLRRSRGWQTTSRMNGPT